MKIICLKGFSKSGKDEFVKYLRLFSRIKTFTFADEVKYQLARALGIEPSALFASSKDSIVNINGSAVSLRQCIRDMSLILKNQVPEYYARVVTNQMHPDKDAIITDLRFLVEYEHLQKTFPHAEIVVIEVRRPGIEGQPVVSEQEQLEIPFDWIIDNDSDIKELREAALVVAKETGVYKPTKKRKNYGKK